MIKPQPKNNTLVSISKYTHVRFINRINLKFVKKKKKMFMEP